jgi:nucleotide-binding universal stress UspA family protein
VERLRTLDSKSGSMALVLVPIRYPLSKHSKATLRAVADRARESEASLVVLHVTPYHANGDVTRRDLKRAAERVVGCLPNARYLVRLGFLIEETILEEVAAEDADVVVIGRSQASRWQRILRRIADDPDVERYLRQELDCEVLTVAEAG